MAFARELGEKEYQYVGGGPRWGSRPGWGGGPGWGRGGSGGGPGWGSCPYRFYYGRCCSAAEFAEFVQYQSIPRN
ncbi:unnamed protein product [Victoria cruziana]